MPGWPSPPSAVATPSCPVLVKEPAERIRRHGRSLPPRGPDRSPAFRPQTTSTNGPARLLRPPADRGESPGSVELHEMVETACYELTAARGASAEAVAARERPSTRLSRSDHERKAALASNPPQPVRPSSSMARQPYADMGATAGGHIHTPSSPEGPFAATTHAGRFDEARRANERRGGTPSSPRRSSAASARFVLARSKARKGLRAVRLMDQ